MRTGSSQWTGRADAAIQRARIQIERERRRRRQRLEALYGHDPVAYAHDVLGLETWSRQEEMLQAVVEHDQVAVRAGRKVSKSNSAAILAVWFAHVRGGNVFLTSSSYDQIRRILWAEIRRLIERARLPFFVPEAPSTGIKIRGAEITGRTAVKAEGMQGFSGSNVLYIPDEASGIAADILEALEGNLAGGGKMLMLSNPTQTVGTFFDAFHSAKDQWHRVHIASTESPNITGEKRIDGLAVASWVDSQIDKYGETSSHVEVHVKGDFPSQAGDAVIPLALLEAAVQRYPEAAEEGEASIGVDVGWTGDDPSVLQRVIGDTALPAIELRDLNPSQVGARAFIEAERLHERHGRVTVNVDVIGLGAGTYSYLLERQLEIMEAAPGDESWLTVNPVNVAEKATEQPEEGPGYARLRAQVYFAVRQWLAEGGALPEDEMRDGELLAIKKRIDAKGRTDVTKKDELRKELKRSTDRGDALALAVYHPARGFAEGGLAVVSRRAA